MPRCVLSQPIGIETKGGEFTPLLQAAPLPATAKMSFSTAEDNQRVVSVKLYQGSHPKAAFNRQICAFDVVDLPPEPQGAPNIEVTIEISANGALRAAARDAKSGRSHHVRFDERSAGIEIHDLDAPAAPTPRLAAPIGIETKGGMFTPIFAAGARVPAALADVFSTAADNQNAVTIRLYQGLSERAEDNRLLGAFDLTDIPPAPMGVPQIEVHFAIDTDGVLTVTAHDKGTGKNQRIVMDGEDARADVQLADPSIDLNDFKDIFDRLFGEGTEKPAQAPERPAGQRRVFISHASPDAPLARDLVEKLERSGRACWIAPRDVRAGEDYRAEIVAALKNVSHVVAFISEASNHSPHVLREIALAEQYGKRIVPIRVDDVEMRSELEYILQGVHWVRVEGAADEVSRIL